MSHEQNISADNVNGENVNIGGTQNIYLNTEPAKKERDFDVPFMAPDLPDYFVERPEKYNKLKQQLLNRNSGRPLAITTTLKGAGGFGKTTLAKALCHDPVIKELFDGGILWVTLGETPNLVSLLTVLYKALTYENPGFISVEEGATRLSGILRESNILLVIDDVWNSSHLEPFMRGSLTDKCTRLITTRFSGIVSRYNAGLLEVDEMTSSESAKLLRAGINVPIDNLSLVFRLAKRLGEWALMLELVNAILREEVSSGVDLSTAITYVNDLLDEVGVTTIERDDGNSRHKSAEGVIAASLKAIQSNEREHLYQLSVFLPDEAIPVTSVEALWGQSSAKTRKLLTRFDRASFVNFDRFKRDSRNRRKIRCN